MTTRPRASSSAFLALTAVGLGVVVFLVTLIGNRGDGTAVGEQVVILNQNEVVWPFFAAVQQQAASIIESDEAQAAVRAELSAAETVDRIYVDLPGDLALINVRAEAGEESAAVAASAVAGAYLVTVSQDQQRAQLVVEREQLIEQERTLAIQVEELSVMLDGIDAEDPQRVTLGNELDIASRRLSTVRDQLAILDPEIEATQSQYVLLGPADRVDDDGTSLLTALAAGSGAAVLALLAFSFFSSTRTP